MLFSRLVWLHMLTVVYKRNTYYRGEEKVIHRRTYSPRAGTDRNRWAPGRVAVYTRVPVSDDNPRERTRQLVQRVAEQILRDLRDNKDKGYLDHLREQCRQADLYDNHERTRGEVSLP